MSSHYMWAAKGVRSEDVDGFAARLEETLNKLEDQDYEIYDVMDAPNAKSPGLVVIGRKPRRYPRTEAAPLRAKSASLDPARLRVSR